MSKFIAPPPPSMDELETIMAGQGPSVEESVWQGETASSGSLDGSLSKRHDCENLEGHAEELEAETPMQGGGGHTLTPDQACVGLGCGSQDVDDAVVTSLSPMYTLADRPPHEGASGGLFLLLSSDTDCPQTFPLPSPSSKKESAPSSAAA